ncbi:MAG: ATP-binding protein [Deltaproteobacteria bacterium]
MSTAIEALAPDLRWLDQVLAARAELVRRSVEITADAFLGLYIPDGVVDVMLGQERPASDRVAVPPARAGTPFGVLEAAFGLDPVERAILLTAVAPEIDGRYDTIYGYVQNDVAKKRPTIELIADLFTNSLVDRASVFAMFDEDAPLLKYGLVTLHGGPTDDPWPLVARSVRVSRSIVRHLLGDERLAPALRSASALISGPQSEDVERAWASGLVPLVSGGDHVRRAGFVGGAPLVAVDADPTDGLMVQVAYEARLRGAAILVEGAERSHLQIIERHLPLLLDAADGRVAVASELPFTTRRATTVPIAIPPLDVSDRAELWRDALSSVNAATEESTLRSIADRFPLEAGQIERAARRVVFEPPDFESPEADNGRRTYGEAALVAAARDQSHWSLDELAIRVRAHGGWDRLLLPSDTLKQLQEIRGSISARAKVLDTWGFASTLGPDRGVIAMFAGASGTGKTTAASIIAAEVGLELYKVDVATLVSKYIGETEKNLRRIFDEAERTNTMLFFDEADALFGKRSEVKNAHDRYANIEVAYLLQRIETFQGIVILATNLRRNVDEAFSRRIHHFVEFPFPDEQIRERIYALHIPSKAPLEEDVDLTFLARRFELSGGNIRNVVRSAGTLAASEGDAIAMSHFVRSVARELIKLGRQPSKDDFGPFEPLIRTRP